MSNPAPNNRPSNPDNPRVFFDVEVGGEQGECRAGTRRLRQRMNEWCGEVVRTGWVAAV